MRTKLSILAAIVAVGALGAGIAQAASGGSHHGTKAAAAPTRASAQVLFAVVGKKGALNRGLGVASANVLQGTAGRYTVFFKRGVRKCAYEATIGTTGFTTAPKPSMRARATMVAPTSRPICSPRVNHGCGWPRPAFDCSATKASNAVVPPANR